MSKEIDLVLKGGGAKIPALIGAMAALEGLDYTIIRGAGTSAGAIIIALRAAGYSCEEIKDLLFETNIGYLVKDTNFPLMWNWMRNSWGLYKGDRFEAWIAEKLAAKGVVAFSDLKFSIRIFVTDLNTRQSLCIGGKFDPKVDLHTPTVAQAVRMSMSIPFVFKPVRWAGRLIVDGGLVRNFPIKTFDDDKRLTVGVRLMSGEPPFRKKEISTGKTFAMACLTTMLDVMENEHVAEADWARIIQVDTGNVEATDFSISKQKKQKLYHAGDCAVSWWHFERRHNIDGEG